MEQTLEKPDATLPKPKKSAAVFGFILTVLVILISGAVVYLSRSSNQSNDETGDTNKIVSNNESAQKNQTSETENQRCFPVFPKKYLRLSEQNDAVTLMTANEKNEVMLTAYIFNKKFEELTLPMLLSETDYILLINHFNSGGLEAANGNLAASNYGEKQELKTATLQGYSYVADNSVYAATLSPITEDKELVGTGIHIVAHDNATFNKLLEIANGYTVSENAERYNSSGYILPKQQILQANYTDPEVPYTFNLPIRYERTVGNPELGQNNINYDSLSGERICVSYKERETDPCGFSTSGCTCCNTGCDIIDYAAYISRSGKVIMEPVLQKGQGSGSGARFVYSQDHPWLYYTATYYSKDNRTEGVLDLLHLLDSMERTY